MIFFQLPKPNFTAVLISSLIALQITTAEAAITTDPGTNQVAMYSYNANLSDAQPLSGAALEQTTVYMFFNDTPQYSSMNFYCCKGIDGASTGEAHKTPVRDSSAPFVYSADLSQYATTGTRELYVDRIRTDGSGIDNIYVNFSINISTTPIIPTPEPSPNTPALISGIDNASLTEDLNLNNNGMLTANGKLNITDSDAGEASLIAKTVNSNYGTFYTVFTGLWYYAADNNQAAIQNLVSGETLTDSLIVYSIDGTAHTIVITINGIDEANNPALITGIDHASLTKDLDSNNDGTLVTNGKLNITDSDAGEAALIAKTVNGNYGIFYIVTTGVWYYVADNNQAVIQNLASGATLTDSLIVNSLDGTPHTIVITINAIDEANSSALITGIDRASLTEDLNLDNNGMLTANGKLNITDSDAGEASLIAKTVNSNYGTFYTVFTGVWYYGVDNNQAVIQNLVSGETLTDSLIVYSIDGTPHTIVITINGIDEPNNPALITGIDRASVTEDVDPDADNLLEVSGLLNITDSDAGEAAFTAKTVNGNYGSLTINTAGNWSYAANNSQTAIQNLASGATLTDSLIVNSVDGTAHTVVIIILGADESNTAADIILSWVAPAEREDNSALSLSAIAEYKVYYGATQGQYPNSAVINDGTATGYTFTGLPAGTYYFVVTTIDTEGRESQYSSVVTITI